VSANDRRSMLRATLAYSWHFPREGLMPSMTPITARQPEPSALAGLTDEVLVGAPATRTSPPSRNSWALRRQALPLGHALRPQRERRTGNLQDVFLSVAQPAGFEGRAQFELDVSRDRECALMFLRARNDIPSHAGRHRTGTLHKVAETVGAWLVGDWSQRRMSNSSPKSCGATSDGG